MYWAPIEKMSRLTGLDQEKDKNVNMIKNMTIVLNKFIDEADDRIVEKGKEAQSKLKWQDPSIVLFPLYTKLLTCIEGELSMNGIEVPIVLSTVSPEIENIVLKWLKNLKHFATKHLQLELIILKSLMNQKKQVVYLKVSEKVHIYHQWMMQVV